MKAKTFSIVADEGDDGLWRANLTSDDPNAKSAVITTPSAAVLLGEVARLLNMDLGEADREVRGKVQLGIKKQALLAQRKATWSDISNAVHIARLMVRKEPLQSSPTRMLEMRVTDERSRFDFWFGWLNDDGMLTERLSGGHGLHAEGSMLKCEQVAWQWLHANHWTVVEPAGFEWSELREG